MAQRLAIDTDMSLNEALNKPLSFSNLYYKSEAWKFKKDHDSQTLSYQKAQLNLLAAIAERVGKR